MSKSEPTLQERVARAIFGPGENSEHGLASAQRALDEVANWLVDWPCLAIAMEGYNQFPNETWMSTETRTSMALDAVARAVRGQDEEAKT